MFKSDVVLYQHFSAKQKTTDLKGKIIAIQDPQKPGKIMTRRVIGVSGEWVRRCDDGGFAQVPREHLWVECENDEHRVLDSITTYGFISRKMAIGTVQMIVWPPERAQGLQTLEERVRVQDKTDSVQGKKPRVRHSDTMSNEEVYRKYGRPKYDDNEPDNSEMPGWTMGY